MGFLNKKVWDKYKQIISQFVDDDVGKQKIIWARHVNQLLAFGEDIIEQYDRLEIEALCYYNAFRNWPINKTTKAGELDDENLSIIISKNYLSNKGYINDEGYWNFNWAEDRFVINGLVYKPSGDTQISQAGDEAILFLIILKRDRDTTLDESNYINDLNGKDDNLFLGKEDCTFYGKP